MSDFTERMPPFSIEAEGAVLGAVLTDPGAMPIVATMLTAETFYSEAHRRIFAACNSLRADSKPVDLVTVLTRLHDTGRLSQAGGPAYLTELLLSPPSLAHVGSYAQIVHDKWRAREMIRTAQAIVAQGYAGDSDVSAFVERAAQSVAAVQALDSGTGKDAVLSAQDLAGSVLPIAYVCRAIGLVGGGGAPHLVAGYGFSGKTMALQSLALSLVTARNAWGEHPVRHSSVIHVDMEQGRELTQLRYQRLAKGAGIDLAGCGRLLGLVCMPKITLRPEHADKWRRLMRGRSVMILDSLRAATGGQDENSSQIRAGLDMLGAISEETKCRAIVIHHARKTQEGQASGAQSIRGSSAIFDACDAVYVMSGTKGEPSKFECVKARSHGEAIDDFALSITDVQGNNGDPKWGVQVTCLGARALDDMQTRSAAQKAREVLRQFPGISLSTLKQAIKCIDVGKWLAIERSLGAELVKDSAGHCRLRGTGRTSDE